MPVRLLRYAFVLAIVVSGGQGAVVSAHEPDLSFSTIGVVRDNLTAEFRFSLHDLAGPLGLDANADGQVDADELDAGLPAIGKFIETRLTVRLDDSPVAWAQRSWYVSEAPQDNKPNTADPDGADAVTTRQLHQLINIELNKPLENARQSPVTLTLSADLWMTLAVRHRHVVELRWQDQSDQALLTAESPERTFTLGEPRPLSEIIGEFLLLGVEHIFLGPDHVMFIAGLVIVGGRLRSLVATVTAFTLAHSITLCLASLGVVAPESRWVESLIALSIGYVAVENLVASAPKHRWLLAILFGLVHGFGFAGVLAEIGLPTRGLVASLLAFNLGVELGQLCIVAAIFPLACLARGTRYQRPLVVSVSLLILLFAIGWFVERVGGFEFMPF